MKFKEFKDWCNQRYQDGCWGHKEAIICMQVCEILYKKPFWRREKLWKELYNKPITTKIVEPINEKIKRYTEKNNERTMEKHT